jgi:hypothetical protein
LAFVQDATFVVEAEPMFGVMLTSNPAAKTRAMGVTRIPRQIDGFSNVLTTAAYDRRKGGHGGRHEIVIHLD